MKTNKELFKENGYCVVQNCISNEIKDFVTQYALFDEMRYPLQEKNSIAGKLSSTGGQVPNAHSKYGDPAMETLLATVILDVMQKTLDMTLYPTYSYYRVYRPGDVLHRHTDRPACEISATLCFNYSYDDYSWPICFENASIDLKPGDMAIYKGHDLEHWRDTFVHDDINAWHVQGFFHYVDANGPYSHEKFDGRDSLGLPSLMEQEYGISTSDKDYIIYL